MRSYQRVWLVLVTLLGVPCALLAFVSFPLPVTITVAVSSALFIWATSFFAPWWRSTEPSSGRSGEVAVAPTENLYPPRQWGADQAPYSPRVPATMTDAELIFAWRWSFVQVVRARSTHELHALAEVRGRVLDELERRDPAGFENWIVSGARAASDPSRFLRIRAEAEPEEEPR